MEQPDLRLNKNTRTNRLQTIVLSIEDAFGLSATRPSFVRPHGRRELEIPLFSNQSSTLRCTKAKLVLFRAESHQLALNFLHP